jgi:hypothetical protein
VNPPESHDPSFAMPDSLARPARSPLWTRLWDGIFPLLFFPLATLALYWAAMEDVPRGDQVILWEIFRRLD